MHINRLFEIVYLLLNRGTATAGELAEHFEVSKRTILRDVDALSQAGIPIYTTQGRNGGISLLDNFVLDKTAISDEEQNHILFALQSLSSAEHMDVADTLSKLQTLFNKTDANWIEVDLSRWGNSNSDKAKFETLKDAIIKRQAVSFTYLSSCGEKSDRTAYPLKLIFKSRSWYLQAFCLRKRDYRTFKINRMMSVSLASASFEGRSFSPPPIEYLETVQKLSHLILRFLHHAAYRVYDEFDEKDIAINDDGSLTVDTYLPEDEWLYGYLLSFGPNVNVIEPLALRETLLAQIERMKITI